MKDKIRLIYNKIENRIDEICDDGFVLKENQQEYETLTDLEDFIDSLPEEPSTKVLEEEATRFVKTKEFYESEENPVVLIARHFAEWQKQQMKETLQTEYEKGRFDMREEMVKDAVGGVIHHFADDEVAAVHYDDPKGTPMSIYVSSKGLSAGDKVKIIIVKEKEENETNCRGLL